MDFEVLSSKLADVLAKAAEQQVHEFVVPSVSAANFEAVSRLHQQYDQVHVAFGLHPCFMSSHTVQDTEYLVSMLDQQNACAVGEIGLDFFITQNADQRVAQIELFNTQLAIAQKYSLPVILHVRKAHDQVLQCLKAINFQHGGIVHAFNGSLVQAERYTREFDFKLGFGGAISHAKARKLRHLASVLPLTDIVLETDAPDMPLAQMQESYNQPANVSCIAKTLFELRQETDEVIAEQLVKNTRQCLKLTY